MRSVGKRVWKSVRTRFFGVRFATLAGLALGLAAVGTAGGDQVKPIRVSLLQIPPYAVIGADGDLQGTFVAFARNVAARSEWPVVVDALPAARLHKYMQSGRSDCTIYIRTPATEAIAEPIVDLGLDFRTAVVPRASINLKSYAQLKDVALGVSRGTVFGHRIDTDPQINRTFTKDYLNAAHLMKKGRIDAILGIEWSILHDLATIGFPKDQIGPSLILDTNPLWLFCSRRTSMTVAQRDHLADVVRRLVADGGNRVLNTVSSD